jgi:hypothetical protein
MSVDLNITHHDTESTATAPPDVEYADNKTKDEKTPNKSWSEYRQVPHDYVCTYTTENFTRYIPPHLIKNILEVGSRDLTEARSLLRFYPGAHVTSFECAPYNMEICQARLHPECGFFFTRRIKSIGFCSQSRR